MADRQIVIEEQPIPGYRLGRNVNHDEKSKDFKARRLVEVKTIRWRRYGWPFSQGNLGRCTGCSAGAVLQMLPFWQRGRRITLDLCTRFYSRATEIDPFAGQFPPEDTGSDGLSVAKALKEMGFISGYTWAFGLQHFRESLMAGPAIAGIPWYDSMDHPDANHVARISPGAGVRGGHEIAISGQIVQGAGGEDLIDCWQSWGLSYGRRGRFFITVADFDRLLGEQGDATFFVR